MSRQSQCLGPYLHLAQSFLLTSCPPHYRRWAAPSPTCGWTWMRCEAIDDNALAPAARPPSACQPSTLVARSLRPAKPSTPRAQEGKAHDRRAPQNFPLQLGLRSHLAVARPLPVHWLRPLTTPATTPAKVHAGLNRDFLKKTPCALHSGAHPQLFFLAPAHQRRPRTPRKRHCRPNSPSRKRLSHWIGLLRPTALPLIYPSAHIGRCPRPSLQPEPAGSPLPGPGIWTPQPVCLSWHV